MEYKDLKEYKKQPSHGGFESLTRRINRRRTVRWSVGMVAILAVVGSAGWWLLDRVQTSAPEVQQVAVVASNAPIVVSTSDVAPSSVAANTSPTVLAVNAKPSIEQPAAVAVQVAEMPMVEENITVLENNALSNSSEVKIEEVSGVDIPLQVDVTNLILDEPEVVDEAVVEPEQSQPTQKNAGNAEASNLLWAPNMLITTADEVENRQFRVLAPSVVTNFHIGIYNRRGQLVFSSSDINQAWDATYRGAIVPQGAYVWVASYVDGDGKAHREKGTITVVR